MCRHPPRATRPCQLPRRRRARVQRARHRARLWPTVHHRRASAPFLLNDSGGDRGCGGGGPAGRAYGPQCTTGGRGGGRVGEWRVVWEGSWCCCLPWAVLAAPTWCGGRPASRHPCGLAAAAAPSPLTCRRLGGRGAEPHRAHHHIHQEGVSRGRLGCARGRCPRPSDAAGSRAEAWRAPRARRSPLPAAPHPTALDTTWGWPLRT